MNMSELEYRKPLQWGEIDPFLLLKLYILFYMLVENLVEIVDTKYLEVYTVLVHLLLMLYQNGQK